VITPEELWEFCFHRNMRVRAARFASWNDVEDILQDSFLMAWKMIAQRRLRSPDALPAAVLTIVQRRAIDYQTALPRKYEVELNDLHAATIRTSSPTPDTALIAEEDAQKLQELVAQAFTRLGARDREIARIYMGESTYEEARAQLGLNKRQMFNVKHRSTLKIEQALTAVLGKREVLKKNRRFTRNNVMRMPKRLSFRELHAARKPASTGQVAQTQLSA
jgi:DNA-directed RNA polymerase specialized sigma24 family protein